jgi:hypothetical protein
MSYVAAHGNPRSCGFWACRAAEQRPTEIGSNGDAYGTRHPRHGALRPRAVLLYDRLACSSVHRHPLFRKQRHIRWQSPRRPFGAVPHSRYYVPRTNGCRRRSDFERACCRRFDGSVERGVPLRLPDLAGARRGLDRTSGSTRGTRDRRAGGAVARRGRSSKRSHPWPANLAYATFPCLCSSIVQDGSARRCAGLIATECTPART